MWEGRDFKMKIRNVEGYRNYDRSDFAEAAPLLDDDKQLEEIWKSQHSLSEFIDEKNFKSYAELKNRLYRVLMLDNAAPSVAAEPDPEPETSTVVPMTSSSASVDEDLSFESFYKLHIPIYSDPGNYFAFDSGLYRLEPGWAYIVDPTREHTFFNASMEDRYHIMAGTDMKKREAAKWSNKDRGKPAGFDSIKHELNKEFFI
jgi:hypothetical protein